MMNLKERLRIAKIKQDLIAENTGLSLPYVNQVLNGARSSSKVTNEASRLLDEFLKDKPEYKVIFGGENG